MSEAKLPILAPHPKDQALSDKSPHQISIELSAQRCVRNRDNHFARDLEVQARMLRDQITAASYWEERGELGLMDHAEQAAVHQFLEVERRVQALREALELAGFISSEVEGSRDG